MEQERFIIGITGGSGCGKTTLLRCIGEKGGLVLDCDEIYHQLLQTDENLLLSIAHRFPGVVENGALQRKKLGAIVFADEKALSDLNRLTHTAVKAEVLRRLKNAPKLVAIDAVALFEGDLAEICHVTVAVTAPKEARIQRLMARDGISREYAQNRIEAQRTDGEFSALCQYTLENTGDIGAFRTKCLAFLTELDII
ncbi:MAG: dephospho-CoA kinase [Ruminococcaceae bacterium]|nr:dephospho-CoA kinase [Oscillospiraceae bacterium]